MKKVFVLLAVLTAAVNVNAGENGPDFTDNGIGYDITSSTTCKVVKYRDANGNSMYSGSINIPSTASYGSATYTVTCIGESAFSRSTITSVIIPETVTAIEDDVFYMCVNLTSVYIGKNVAKIADDSYDTSEVFERCSSLTSINVDANNAYFADINGVLTTKDKKTLLCYPGGKPETSYTTPNGVEIIGIKAFNHADNLVEIIFSNDVTTLKYRSVSLCEKLQVITMGDGLTTIDDWSHWNGFIHEECYNFKTLIIGANLPLDYVIAIIKESKYRGYSVDASKNKYVTVSGNVLFSKDMTALYTVMTPISGAYTIPSTVTNIGDNAFDGCENMTSVTFPNSVTSIGNYAFSNCRGLTSVIIPNSVASIGQGAFYGCENLLSVIIGSTSYNPNSFSRTRAGGTKVVTIGEMAFAGLQHLQELVIGANVTTIGYGAFRELYELKNVTNYATTPQVIDEQTFYSMCPEAVLHVSTGCKSAYEAAEGWNRFYTIVEDAETTGIRTVGSDEEKGTMFDLNGRRVENTVNGVYIRNGRKVIINK